MTKISDMLLKLKVFRYDKSIDVDTGYYHIQISKDERNLCKITLPWGKYQCKLISIGVSTSPDILQEKMNDLLQGFYFIHSYICRTLCTVYTRFGLIPPRSSNIVNPSITSKPRLRAKFG